MFPDALSRRRSLRRSASRSSWITGRAPAAPIGMDTVAKAQPDGYTLLMTATPFVISSNLYKKLPFDPISDFAPVT